MKNLLLSGMLFALLLSFPLTGLAQQVSNSPALSSLVNTEREFAATSLKEGIRASFMKYFADDGVSISPKPHIYKETALKTPPPKNPLARRLFWEPVVADVSSSGDLGYTMGPASLKDSAKQEAPLLVRVLFFDLEKAEGGNLEGSGRCRKHLDKGRREVFRPTTDSRNSRVFHIAAENSARGRLRLPSFSIVIGHSRRAWRRGVSGVRIRRSWIRSPALCGRDSYPSRGRMQYSLIS
jgi:hypothetical protein